MYCGSTFFLFSLSIISCSSDEPEQTSPYASSILGTWQITHYGSSFGSITSWVDWDKTTTTATFNSDGTYSGRGYYGLGSGTYKLEGKSVYCYIEGELYMRYYIISMPSDTETILAMYPYPCNSEGEITIKCKKIN